MTRVRLSLGVGEWLFLGVACCSLDMWFPAGAAFMCATVASVAGVLELDKEQT